MQPVQGMRRIGGGRAQGVFGVRGGGHDPVAGREAGHAVTSSVGVIRFAQYSI